MFIRASFTESDSDTVAILVFLCHSLARSATGSEYKSGVSITLCQQHDRDQNAIPTYIRCSDGHLLHADLQPSRQRSALVERQKVTGIVTDSDCK